MGNSGSSVFICSSDTSSLFVRNLEHEVEAAIVSGSQQTLSEVSATVATALSQAHQGLEADQSKVESSSAPTAPKAGPAAPGLVDGMSMPTPRSLKDCVDLQAVAEHRLTVATIKIELASLPREQRLTAYYHLQAALDEAPGLKLYDLVRLWHSLPEKSKHGSYSLVERALFARTIASTCANKWAPLAEKRAKDAGQDPRAARAKAWEKAEKGAKDIAETGAFPAALVALAIKYDCSAERVEALHHQAMQVQPSDVSEPKSLEWNPLSLVQTALDTGVSVPECNKQRQKAARNFNDARRVGKADEVALASILKSEGLSDGFRLVVRGPNQDDLGWELAIGLGYRYDAKAGAWRKEKDVASALAFTKVKDAILSFYNKTNHSLVNDNAVQPEGRVNPADKATPADKIGVLRDQYLRAVYGEQRIQGDKPGRTRLLDFTPMSFAFVAAVHVHRSLKPAPSALGIGYPAANPVEPTR